LFGDAGWPWYNFRHSDIVRFVQGGVVKTFRSGAYTRDDWISVGDIGSKFNGVVLTPTEFARIEDAYVSSALRFLAEAGVNSLAVAALENHGGFQTTALTLADGHSCDLLACADLARLNLRSEIWCRLESKSAFLHSGYDYYMYVGVSSECPAAIQHATNAGLFIESFDSPYRES